MGNELIQIVKAPCQSKYVDPELFFPDSTDLETTRKAQALCAQCETQTKTDCLSFALRNNVQYGIWGGLTELERKAIQRRLEREKYRANQDKAGDKV